ADVSESVSLQPYVAGYTYINTATDFEGDQGYGDTGSDDETFFNTASDGYSLWNDLDTDYYSMTSYIQESYDSMAYGNPYTSGLETTDSIFDETLTAYSDSNHNSGQSDISFYNTYIHTSIGSIIPVGITLGGVGGLPDTAPDGSML